MPACESHLRAGVVAHGALVCLTFAAVTVGGHPQSAFAYAGTALPVTLLGAVFPDIDHHASKAYRLVRTAVPLGLAAVVAALGYAGWTALRPMLTAAGGPQTPFVAGICWAAMVAGMWMASQPVVPTLRPPHRGPTHRLPVGILVGAVVAGVAAAPLLALGLPTPLTGASLIAMAFVTGIASHLRRDRLLTERETYLCIR